MREEAFASREGLELRSAGEPGPGFRQRLAGTWFGSGRLRYQRVNVDEQLRRLAGSDFISLADGERVIGSYVLTPLRLRHGSDSVNAIYRSCLTLDREYRGRGLAAWMIAESLQRAIDARSASLSYGLIETGNVRSARLLAGQGSTPIATLRTHLLYRQWPRACGDVVRVDDEAARLALFHRSVDDTTVSAAVPGDAPVYCLEDDHGRQAAASVRLVQLNLIDRPFSLARAYSGLVRLIPPARRRFDPACLGYLALDHVVADDSATFARLVDELMRRYRVHMVSLSLDPQRDLYRTLSRQGLFGAFARATAQHTAVTVMRHGPDAPKFGGPVALAAPDV